MFYLIQFALATFVVVVVAVAVAVAHPANLADIAGTDNMTDN
jgi:hypothetical protein